MTCFFFFALFGRMFCSFCVVVHHTCVYVKVNDIGVFCLCVFWYVVFHHVLVMVTKPILFYCLCRSMCVLLWFFMFVST